MMWYGMVKWRFYQVEVILWNSSFSFYFSLEKTMNQTEMVEHVNFNLTANVSCSDLITPMFYDYMSRIDNVTLSLIVFCCVETLITFILFVICCHFFCTYVSSSARSSKLAWLAGIFPLASGASCIGMIVPRAMPLSDMIIVLYISRCLFGFVDLVIDCCGGIQSMSDEHSVFQMKLNTGPCCCCFVCLPKLSPTVKNIRIMRFFVYQNAIFRPILFFFIGVFWVDRWGSFDTKMPFKPFITTLVVLSSLIALYGVNVFHMTTKEPLKKYKIHILMSIIQFVILIFNLQAPIFLACSSLVSCDEMLLPSYAKTSLWHHMAVVTECLLLLSLAMWFFRPQENCMFDKFYMSKADQHVEGNETVHLKPELLSHT
ncbi:Organic solute transporter alpha-like protein 3 [Trichinella pseudospiralis]|uniref:Organic solute transporter alpha-like protein 3 n=1 Tax=Trichinella pseudospiralis TaxID=6337 RepID=A0A0V1E6J0_TRIPS|nr:Organic solute transporter alpha-like protein 3 [Trichinella pseudospiralis]KRY68946.1 Organic solute transporter alpha-like protein 3 [Trichinella pseudospiralis]